MVVMDNSLISKQDGKLSRRDINIARAFKAAPLVAWAACTFPVSLVFVLLYFIASADNALYLLTAFASLGIGAIIGLVAALIFFLAGRRWTKNLRERLASDGITVDELPFFMNELKSAEKLSLKRIEKQNLALAEAYRETLAARLTASRLLARAKRELVATDGRQARVKQMRIDSARELLEELETDKKRLNSVKDRAMTHLQQAQVRLQSIEALAGRSSLGADSDMAMQRLESNLNQPPLALEAAKLEIEAREQLEEILSMPSSEKES
jgi:hypothetical protein